MYAIRRKQQQKMPISCRGAEKSAADVKAEVVDKVAAGDVKDAEGKDLSQDILDANAKVEDKTVKDGSSEGRRVCRRECRYCAGGCGSQ